MVQDRAIVNGR